MSTRSLMNDRFTVALMLALGLHALVLLAVSFAFEINPLKKAAETLDVVLVNWSSEEEPEEADFLAQASQRGGGESTETPKPAEDISANTPSITEGDMPEQQAESLPSEATERLQELVSQDDSARPVQQISRVEQAEETPSAADLMQQSMQAARLTPQSQRRNPWQSKLPRRRFISANTKQYEFASYMQAWVAKVERVGNLNYPMEVRQRKLVGNLLMTVGINRDGSIESIDIRRSSGFDVLDEAAVRIVRLAAPYSPLPENISNQVDVLHITRTWKFSTGYTLE
ncbi:MAG: energy transducer TonB [Xanthomonadales bacterium]|nr:energy transducer TonB [Gammaproteobacteria bacterium]NNE04266.1 energy transducer TonB [Xanthomonadales bacterium]NNL95624.1 energy transducer TonB [Xanthomonadales bacterium]